MSKTSLALNNLRGFAVLIVLAFHAGMAYVVTQPAAALPFDEPPYGWLANPIIDSDRWLGFDLFCAFQFLYMMQLMFFLSGLFVWPSLQRKGAPAFLYDRFVRLGVPFILGVYVLMPTAYYAVYRVTAVDPGWSAFWSHWLALPFWPAGPMWFLWLLFVFNVGVVLLHRVARRPIEILARAVANTTPIVFFAVLVAVSGLIYLASAALFSPLQWIDIGPFGLQPLFAPQYAIYLLAGLVVGANGLEGGLLGPNLERRWIAWLTTAIGSFALWIAFMALIKNELAPPALQIAADIANAVFAASACLAAAAMSLRFAAARWPRFDSISENGYGIYLFHYVFVLWAQYVLLSFQMPAIVKGVLAFCATVALSWAATAALCSFPLGARLIRGQRRISAAAARSTERTPLIAPESVKAVDRRSAGL
jgi:glucans biosynthesis protein C